MVPIFSAVMNDNEHCARETHSKGQDVWKTQMPTEGEEEWMSTYPELSGHVWFVQIASAFGVLPLLPNFRQQEDVGGGEEKLQGIYLHNVLCVGNFQGALPLIHDFSTDRQTLEWRQVGSGGQQSTSVWEPGKAQDAISQLERLEQTSSSNYLGIKRDISGNITLL